MTDIETYYRKIAREEAAKVLAEHQPQLGEFLSTTAAATYLGVHRSWLDQARVNGRAEQPPYYRFDRAIRYKLADLQKYIEANRREVAS
jgi:hypothetical protein